MLNFDSPDSKTIFIVEADSEIKMPEKLPIKYDLGPKKEEVVTEMVVKLDQINREIANYNETPGEKPIVS